MDKHRQPRPGESPALDGPDYIALVIEWDDLADLLGGEDERGTAATPSPGMSMQDHGSSWNSVDEASLESFPASDPPAWGSSHAVAEVPEDIPEEVTAPFKPTAQMSRVRRFVLGLAAIAALFSMIEGLRRLRRRRA
jgi:hypothetical protein